MSHPTALPPSSALKAFISLPSVAELDRAFITRRLKSGWPPPAPPIGSCSPNTYQLGPLLAAQGQCIVGLVPLSVRCAVDKHNTVLHQGLGTDQFVVGRIIDNIDYSCLACTTLRAPGEVPHVQPQGPVLLVASPHTDCVYAAGANLENTRRQELGHQGEARDRRELGRDGGNSQCNYDKP